MRVADASADLRGGLGPDEGFWVFVPGLGVQQDGSLKGGDAVDGPSAKRFWGDSGKPALGQPGPYARVFVRAVVVADQMELAAPVLSVEDLQERPELLVRVPAEASL